MIIRIFRIVITSYSIHYTKLYEFRFRRYRFFDIGNDHYYYDDYLNESVLRKVLTKCYLPTNELLLKLIQKHQGKFKVSFSISGTAIDQFKLYAPEVLDSFKRLVSYNFV